MTGEIVFDPLVPWPVLWTLAGIAVAFVAFALWRRFSGWWLRALAAIALLAAVAQPSLQREERRALSDIVILVVDESASQQLGDRPEQTAAAVARIEAEVAALPNTELRKITVGDGEKDAGTLAMTALSQERPLPERESSGPQSEC